MLIGYMRASTDSDRQVLDLQRDGACRKLWRRTQDGPWRPQFHTLLNRVWFESGSSGGFG